jgi:hypothetical protein
VRDILQHLTSIPASVLAFLHELPLLLRRRSPAKHNFLRRSLAALALVLAIGTSPIHASDQRLTFKIPPVKIPLNIKDQHVTITASALITVIAKDRGLNILKLELTADLSDLQQNITGLLSSELDKDDRCGDRIAIESATLTPLDPAASRLFNCITNAGRAPRYSESCVRGKVCRPRSGTFSRPEPDE